MPQTAALLLRRPPSHSGSVQGSQRCIGPEAAEIVQILRSTEFRLISCASWNSFRRCAAAAHVAVLVALRLDLDSTMSELRETAREEFPCSLVLVTSSEPENLCQLASVRVTKVVLPSEVKRLPETLRAVAINDGRLLLRGAIRRREMHLTLKRALRGLVDLPVPERAPRTGAERRFPRTVADLGGNASVSADYLRHLAVEAKLPLGVIIHRHVALRALDMLAVGVHPDVAAERLSYEYSSGLHALIKRHFGTRASTLLRSGVHPLYVATAKLIDPNIQPHEMT